MFQKSRTAEATLRLLPEQCMEEMPLSSRVTLPAAHATARVTALMEQAAARLVQQELRAAETSVGIAMNITHAAPALATGGIRGMNVRAVARHRGVAGGLHHVTIEAFDESGLIASAEHTRAVVIGGRARPPARRRAGVSSMPLDV